MVSDYHKRITEQKKIIDKFYSEKENIGTLEDDGSLYISVDDALLITEQHAFLSAKYLKERLKNVGINNLNERGISRMNSNVYSLSSTLSKISNQKLDSNMAKDPNYTPSLAEHLALINHVSSMLYSRSLASYKFDEN